MEQLDKISFSTWSSLWKYIGIQAHTKYGNYYMKASYKKEDVRDRLLSMVGMSKIKPPLLGETREDFFIRKVYGSAFDCFHRPIKGPTATIITVCLRTEKYVENTKQLVINYYKINYIKLYLFRILGIS